MVEIRFDTAALARVRFAVSPLVETMRSVSVLDDRARLDLHLPWIERARRDTRELDLEQLRALQPSDVYTPDFVHPPPTSPLAEIGDELAAMMATPAAQIRAEVQGSYSDAPVPPALERFIADPDGAVRALADLLRDYWDRALSPHWPRIRALLEGDILYRTRRIADGGAERLFADLDPTVIWRDGVLRITKCSDSALDLDERGLLFVPSVFVWPEVLLISAAPWQPTLIYPARGVGMLWAEKGPAPPAALAKLIGGNRAAVLTALDRPRSTTELARALRISTGGASQHLAVLRDAGLIERHRVQRLVLYLRSPDGDALVASATRRLDHEPRGI